MKILQFNVEIYGIDRIKNWRHYLPTDPLKLYISLLWFSIIFVPIYIWSGIMYLLKMRKDVKGKVILVTGASKGLGRELALSFSRLGAKVACVDLDEDGNTKTAEMIRAENGTAKAYIVDITKREKIKLMHEAVKNDLGNVDILINNAGVVKESIYVNSQTDDLVKEIVNVNLLGQFWMNKEILPSMLERNSGHIVAISSVMSLTGSHSLSAYAASKWGVTGMMESLDQELLLFRSNVHTTTVCPYFLDSNEEVMKSLSINLPGIPLPLVCSQVVDGILKNKKMFTVPGFMYSAIILYKVMPSKLQYRLQKIFRGSYQYNKSDIEAVKKYQKIK